MRDSFSVPSLAAGFAAVNASTAVYDAASVIRRRSGGLKKIRQSIKPSTGCVGKRATIQNISMNPAMAAMETSKIRKENKVLRRELARMVLQEAIEKDGAVLSDGASGDQIRRAVGIMDCPVTEALQSGAAPEVLELWRVHTEHISKVYKNGGKGRGRQNSTYHPILMTWAITLLAHTSSGTYNEVAKLMMLPHIRTVYKKASELITTKKD